ncbi:MBL fold metallo-hydrolase [Psychrosphaera sp. F3M07]|uniref:MBL fold metallo-hydrolase n=1 Tax=Psychrosphaera sp. F3M07 TaxID=2841560 RepID=UPI001C09738F|nr:MBL fold metallo-hydrolase [Psychrosphaera sp. F3M07]MBU2918270.1 MBL fold metallo-hydrolase [Psychrosphaera sp. F3M07]
MKKVILLITSLLLTTSLYAANKTPLTLKVINADSNSFHVNSTLVYGETEALVIDAGFTKADALRIAANVLDSGKKLTTIFISQADPDFYFGAETLQKLFPEAQVLTTPAVAKVIEKKMEGKLAFWGPKMGANAPKNPLLPKAIKQTELTVDGYKIEIKGTSGLLAHRPYLWIPSKKALVGNIAVFGGVHVWTADTQTQDKLDAWLTQLTQMQNLAPQIVVPGHMQQDTNLDVNNINYTISYLNTFIEEKKNSQHSKALIDKMTVAFPNSQFALALNIGAKVHMGEMKW